MSEDCHKYELQIIESHLDTFGHVNNATYLQLYEQARWDLIESRGFGLKEIQKRKIGPVILSANISFRKELSNREIIVIETRFKQMNSPLIMEIHQRMIKDGKQVASRAVFETGLMDLEKRKLITPTEEWMKVIEL